VVQRYGDVSGGAEFHARLIAQRLAPHWDLTVLTTCARDHLTWANEFDAGSDKVDGVKVLRFPVERTREMEAFNRLSRRLFGFSLERMREERWVAEQGPLVPGLLRFLSEQRGGYDGFLFFTYLYAPTIWGLPLVADRALLVPTAHDEEPFRFDVYGDVFEQPRALFCNTPEEAELIASRYPRHAPLQVVGVGVEAKKGRPERFRKTFGLTRDYLLYVGRIEAGKGVPELLRFHADLARRDPAAPELVLAGQPAMPLPTEGVRVLGRISEEQKEDGLAGALAAVVPSRFESLSLLALEAFAQGTPVLAREDSEVLKGQVQRSQAGALFKDARTFQAGVEQVTRGRLMLGRQARAFAAQHPWGRVVSTYCAAMDAIQEKRR
jgi:glycosyltransferase involved in cell wall biosynthesis